MAYVKAKFIEKIGLADDTLANIRYKQEVRRGNIYDRILTWNKRKRDSALLLLWRIAK